MCSTQQVSLTVNHYNGFSQLGVLGWRRAIGAYLGIINLACAEQRFERVISRDEEAGKVHKKLASNVEEDQEEVDPNKAKESVHLRDGGLLLKVVEHRVLGQL